MPFDFEANKNVDSLEVVPEQYRGLYAEGDGGYTISDSAASLVADYVGTTKALEKSKADKKAASDEAASRRVANKGFEELMASLGIEEDNQSAEGLKAHIDGLIDEVKGGKEVRINAEKIQQQADLRIADAIKSKDEELHGMATSLHKHMIGEAAAREIAAQGGSADLLMPHVAKHARVLNDNGEYGVRIVDDQGDVRYDGSGGFMNMKGLIEEMKSSETYAVAFQSQTPGGSGTPAGSGRKPAPKQQADMSSVQKIAGGLERRTTGRMS